jgi:hypothetical protein
VHVSLPASGCASREHREFELPTEVIRMDNHGGRYVSYWGTTCGPFRSAEDFEPGDSAPEYSSELSVAVDHPKVENAQYDIEISTLASAVGRRVVLAIAIAVSVVAIGGWTGRTAAAARAG